MVEVYKVMKVEGKVNVYVYLNNATPPQTDTLKEICKRLKMEAMLLSMTFGGLPKLFGMGSDEGRGSKKFGQVAGEQVHNLTLIVLCLGVPYNMPHISSGSTTVIGDICFGEQPGLSILPK